MREVGSIHSRRGAAAVAASLLAHAVLIAVIGVQLDRALAPFGDPGASAVPPLAPGATADSIDGIALVDEDRIGPLLEATQGPADQDGFDREHPLPSAAIDLPGHQAAATGGRDRQGGAPSFTGRRDRDQLRSQIWNGLARYQVPHLRTAERSATPEELARAPEPGFDGRTSRTRRARAGAASARTGEAGTAGHGGRVAEVERVWADADPRLDTGPAAPTLKRQSGSTEPGRERALIDRGARAVETERHAETAQDADSAAAASNERDPMPLELTRASGGGRGAGGVRGSEAKTGAAPGLAQAGAGTAATRMNLAAGPGRPALRAHRSDPYFRRMYQRLDSIVVYPQERALALDQGEVVVAFTLFANGSIGDVRVLKSSGFEEFDGELTRALRVAAPFGPVPLSLRGRSDRVGVTAPYKFSSPLIR